MSGPGAKRLPGGGSTGGIPGALQPILAVLEPAGYGDAGTSIGDGARSPAAPLEAAALVTEAVRVAAELRIEARVVTWAPSVDPDPLAVATALAGLAERLRPVAILLADTALGRQLAPMVARELGSGAVLGCSDVVVCSTGEGRGGRLSFVKPVYGGWLEQVVEAVEGFIPVATLDLTGMTEAEDMLDGPPAPEVLQLETGAAGGVRVLEVIPPDPGTVDLVHAKRIVAAGAGGASDELLAAAQQLAALLQGSLGTTRPVVDDGLLPKERLIGQTGRTVAPELYLALGISGSPHHVAGVRKAEKIVSINRDARAPIFQFSDVGYVADLEVVLPALVAKIKEYRDAGAVQR